MIGVCGVTDHGVQQRFRNRIQLALLLGRQCIDECRQALGALTHGMPGAHLTLFGQTQNDRAPVRANLPAHQARPFQFVDQTNRGCVRQAEAQRFVRASIVKADQVQCSERRARLIGVAPGAALGALHYRNGDGAQKTGRA